MDIGQISLMPVNVGIPPCGAQLSSLTMLLSEPERQAGGPFAGLLEGMAPTKTPQGVAAPVSVGKGVPASDKNGETAPTTAVQDGVSGLMAGLLNALDTAGKPLATGTEQSAEVPATANRSDRKPQDVVLNADGLRMALLTQVNGGRMPQAGGMVELQTVHGADKPLKSATESSAEVPARADTLDKKPQDVAMNANGMQPPPLLTQLDGGKMPQAGGAVEQQTVHGADMPLASATEGSTKVPARADTLDKRPQDVAMNADGIQPLPLLTQVNGGRIPQAGGVVEQQTVHGADKPLASATEGSAEIPARADNFDKKPQDVAMNAAGMQPLPLLTQVNGGRIPQAGGVVEQQTVHGADKPLASATEGSAEIPARADNFDKKPQDVAMNAAGMQPPPLLTQVNGGRMPQADGTVMQQAIAASMADTSVTSLSNNGGVPGIVASTSTDAVGGLNPPESLLNPNRPAMVEHGPMKGASTDPATLEVVPKGSESQYASQKEPDRTTLPAALPPRQVSAIVEQQNIAVVNSTVASVSGTPGPDKGGAEVRTTTFSGVEVTAQPQQEVTLFRSASLDVALAESVPRNEVRISGQTQISSSAQNTPVAEIPAVSTAMTAQAEPQQNVRPANSGVMPVQAAPLPASSQQPDQAVTAINDTLDGTGPVQAAVVPAAGKINVEAGGDAAQTRPESAATATPVQSITVEALKFVGAGSSGKEFNSGDDKGTAGNFMNGQFQATLMNQQGNVEGTSVANNVSAPVQNDAHQSGLAEQILPQVNASLVNHEVRAGNDQIVLRLSPENLGELKVNLSMDGQSLKVEIVAENHMVRDALLQNTDSLKESLARQNISMQSFSVTTGNPGQRQQQGDWRESGRQQQNTWMTSAGYQTSDTAVDATRLAYQTASAHTMVDLHF
jgi:flagellar hook-length control protein FliK